MRIALQKLYKENGVNFILKIYKKITKNVTLEKLTYVLTLMQLFQRSRFIYIVNVKH